MVVTKEVRTMKSQIPRIRLALFASLAGVLIVVACIAPEVWIPQVHAAETATAKAPLFVNPAGPPEKATAASKATDEAVIATDEAALATQTATAAATASQEAGAANEGNPQLEVGAAVLVGDARSFSVPPTALAYANTDAAAPPQGFGVYPEGSPSYFHEWIFLTHPDDALEVDTPVSTTVGVEFWGDTNDGEARLLVDGVKRWSGDTHGDDANWPGGAFVRYVQITGLQNQPHTVRIEQTGNGDVTVYFVGIGQAAP
jgi:hypothetical protein